MNCVLKQMLILSGICLVITIVFSGFLLILKYLIGEYMIVVVALALPVCIYLAVKEECKIR